ncbi:MAG: tRNA pseudouridine(38-40) synthase TruA [bacterium]
MNSEPKQRYFLELAYDGTDYHGWQIQKNVLTIQSILNDKLSLKLKEQVSVTGAGRTDAGVHASYFVAHFDSMHQFLDEDNHFLKSFNRFLPPGIVIYSVNKVNNTSHARFDAISRTYHYFLTLKKKVFFNRFSYYWDVQLDLEKMNLAASLLKDYKDFTSFSKLHTDVKTNICSIEFAKWENHDEYLVFIIKADRFLRNMVRAIVGTLLEIGNNRRSINNFKKTIEQKDRSLAGTSSPAKGLFLTDIEYPENIFNSKLPKNKNTEKLFNFND